MNLARFYKTWVFAALAVLFFVLGHFAKNAASEREFDSGELEEYSVIPNKESLLWLSLGYRHMLSDLIWIRALQYNNLKNEAHLVEHFADAIIHLDPDFEPVYKWASVSTLFTGTITAQDVETSNSYLQKAYARFPQKADYPYSIGLNLVAYYSSDNKLELAKRRSEGVYYLQQAMVLPGAPPNIAMLISGVLSGDNQETIKIQFLEQALLTENDPAIRKRLQMRLFSLSKTHSPSLLLSAKRDFWRMQHRSYLPLVLEYILYDNP
ncbi:MAG: hypothetical protein WC966_07885 [Bradymonadales bacterium]|jgi:hypothetical protein